MMPIAVLMDAFVPILGLLLLGYVLRRKEWLQDGFWSNGERLTYYILTPSLIVSKLSQMEPGSLPVMEIGLVVVATLGTGMVVLTCLQLVRPMEGAAFTSVVQGGIRFNTYIALALIGPLYGDQGLGIATVAIAFTIATVNILCVLSFALFLPGAGLRAVDVLLQLVKNPLLLACGLGGLVQASGQGLPYGLGNTLHTLSSAALPMGVMAVGAALARVKVRLPSAAGFISAGSVKFLVLPAASMGLSVLFHLPPEIMAILLIIYIMPTAPSGYILARQLGGDANLMAELITSQTVLASVALPILALLLGGLVL